MARKKNHQSCEICQIQFIRVFTKYLDWVCIGVENGAQIDYLFKIDEQNINSQFLAKNVTIYIGFWGKIKKEGIQ